MLNIQSFVTVEVVSGGKRMTAFERGGIYETDAVVEADCKSFPDARLVVTYRDESMEVPIGCPDPDVYIDLVPVNMGALKIRMFNRPARFFRTVHVPYTTGNPPDDSFRDDPVWVEASRMLEDAVNMDRAS